MLSFAFMEWPQGTAYQRQHIIGQNNSHEFILASRLIWEQQDAQHLAHQQQPDADACFRPREHDPPPGLVRPGRSEKRHRMQGARPAWDGVPSSNHLTLFCTLSIKYLQLRCLTCLRLSGRMRMGRGPPASTSGIPTK